MGYNNSFEAMTKGLTSENCPIRWVLLAEHYKNDLSSLNKEERMLYQYIIDNFLVEDSENKSLTGSDGTFVESSPATAASTVGNVGVGATDEFDWATTPQDFTVDGNTVTLDTTATGLTDVVTEINEALSTAGLSDIEAFESGAYVGLRTLSTGSSASFTLDSGTADVLSTLGLSAGTYTGTDSVGETEFSPSFGNVGISESNFVVDVDGSIVSHSVVTKSPLKIRVPGDVTSASSITIKATNPLTINERIQASFNPLQPYLYKGE